MNRDIAILREVIVKLTPLLAGRGLRVTQQGSQAFVQNDRYGKVIRVNIPHLPDDASSDLVIAVQGFIDHEVAHILFTDLAYKFEERVKKPSLMNAWNIVEDTYIERKMAKKFAGSGYNLDKTGQFVLDKLTDPGLAKLKSDDDEGRFRLICVPMMRALAGQPVFQRWMDEHAAWSNKLVEGFVKEFGPANIARLQKADSTADCWELALIMHAIMYPPPPPAPPAPAPKSSEPSKDKSEEKSDDEDGEGSNPDKPEDEDDKGSGGEPSEPKAEDDEADGSEPKPETTDEEPGAGAKDSETEKDDADDGAAADKDEASEDDEQSEPGEGEAGKDGEAGDDAPEDSSDRSDDVGQPESDEGEPDDADEDAEEAGASSGTGGDEPEEEAGAAGTGGADAPEPETESDGPDGGGQPESAGADEDPGSVAEEEGAIAGQGSSVFSDVEIDLEGITIQDALKALIADEAAMQIKDAEYRIYTADYDVIEPYVVKEGYRDHWLVDLDNRVNHMIGPMQKDIERLVASQSKVQQVAGYRSGRLHGAGLHRLMANDDRVFRRRHETKAKRTAVTLLVDNSGSMGGPKMTTGMQAAYALSQTLERVGIKHEVLGFTTVSVPKFPRKQIMDEITRTGVHYSRVEPMLMPIYKGFDERLGPETKRRFADAAARQDFLKNNIDGESVMVATNRILKRPEDRKVLIVLSDGYPAADPTDYKLRKGMYSHLHQAIAFAKKRQVEVIGIGIEDDTVATYYERHVVIQDVDDLPKVVMGQLKQILTAA